jgi:plastocyanin
VRNPDRGTGRKRGVRSLTLALAVLLSIAAAAGVGVARADNGTLTATVGTNDSFSISLVGPSGGPPHNIDPGTYTLLVHDRSSIHNFHLTGPGGVDVSTDIDAIGDKTFTVTLVAGTYKYVCDIHASTMKGSFTVGGASAVPPTTTTAPKSSPPKKKPKQKPAKKKKKP